VDQQLQCEILTVLTLLVRLVVVTVFLPITYWKINYFIFFWKLVNFILRAVLSVGICE
jgi:hypothetical protein